MEGTCFQGKTNLPKSCLAFDLQVNSNYLKSRKTMTIQLGNLLDKSGLEFASSCRQMMEEDMGSSQQQWLPPCSAGVLGCVAVNEHWQ